MQNKNRALVWLRRDLRLEDNRSIVEAAKNHDEVFIAFVFDPTILDLLSNKDRRVCFIMQSVQSLCSKLEKLGSGLIIKYANPLEAIPQLAKDLDVKAVYCSTDYEPNAITRDLLVEQALSKGGIFFSQQKDHVIFEKNEILNNVKQPYTVFTPYRTKWMDCFATFHKSIVIELISAIKHKLAPSNSICTIAKEYPDRFEDIDISVYDPGEDGALRLFENFKKRISRYKLTRDYPALKGPSYLGVHLRFGTISIRQLVLFAYTEAMVGNEGAKTWLFELIWREFYFQILYHNPNTINEEFIKEYRNIRWNSGERAQANFEAWCQGKTGYPIVDAGMRQLMQTGYMHNRLRMICASFLTKHLGIDWRKGEEWFSKLLMDYDQAANVGGWQWCASTGCDAQPYFRIFNPFLQSVKFDEQGQFIRRYVPELKKLSNKAIHNPSNATIEELNSAGISIGDTYPSAIVEHTSVKQAVLERFGKAQNST